MHSPLDRHQRQDAGDHQQPAEPYPRIRRNQVANATSTAANSLSASVLRAIERMAPSEPRASSAPPSAAVAASNPSVTPSRGESRPSSASTVRTALSAHMNAVPKAKIESRSTRMSPPPRLARIHAPSMIGAIAASAAALG